MRSVLKGFLKAPELYLCILIVAIAAVFCVDRIGVTDVNLAVGEGAYEQSSLPIVKKFQEPIRVSFKVSNRFKHDFDLRIIPDDCATELLVDGKYVELAGRSGLCDFGHGFVLANGELVDLGVKDGSQFEVSVRNHGGDGGLNVVVEKSASSVFTILNGVLLGAVTVLVFLVARRMRAGLILSLILALGAALRIGLDLSLPKYDKFGHDVDGHVAYVHYIAENHSIPGVDDCWTCYHPPVYYGASIPAWELASATGIPGTSALQVQSLLLSFAFLFIGFAFLRQFLSGKALTASTALLSLWPVIILVAPRIGNDQLFYVQHALCLWGGVKYLNSGRGKFLVVAAVATALSYWTKTTGAVTMGVFFLFAVAGYFGNCRSLSATKSEVASWIIFALLVVGIGCSKLFGDSSLVGNASGLHSGLRIGSEPGNYIYFDLKSFLTQPYTSPWLDEMGRQYFWNYALKTSLFGEFRLLETALGKFLASLISLSFLGLVVVAARGFWKTRLKAIHWILLLQGVAFFAALAFLRNKIPYSCSNDFRYILPVLLSFVPFVGIGMNVEGSSAKWKAFSYVVIFVFATFSAAFMLAVSLQ